MPIDFSKIPLFAKLPPDELDALHQLMKQRTFAVNETIFGIGDTGTEFYIVEEGTLSLSYPDESGKEIFIAQLKEGDFFGELSLLDGGPRTATARAVTPIVLRSLDREQFHLFLSDHPAASFHIISVMGKRQREGMNKLRGIQNPNEVYERQATWWEKLADFIVNLSAGKTFMLSHAVLIGTWILYNGETKGAFDPAPFDKLSLILSVEAIFFSLFVLISQNHAGERQKIQADLDYQTNLKAQAEVMRVHEKLDKLLTKEKTNG